MPPAYNRQYNFANYQLLNPTAPLVGSQHDSEYNAIKVAIDSLISDLGLIQADDGTLQNGIIRPQHLASDFITGIAAPVAWTTATNYTEADTVFFEAKLYSCVTSHLSGTFSIDLAAGKWALVADFASAVDDAVNITFDPQGAIEATNVQEAIEEAAVDAAAALDALAAGDFLVKTAFSSGSAERVVTDTTTVIWNWATAGQAKAEHARPVVAITATGSLTAAQKFSLVMVDTTSGAVDLTMPPLASEDAGWYVDIIKTNTGASPLFILPPAGTILSGGQAVSKTRRCIPHVVFRIYWTGTLWIAERCEKAPLGAVIDLTTAALPVGYEWPNGQTLASASTNYPDFYKANGDSGVTCDLRGRVSAGKDDMGGSSANRLTDQNGGLDGDTLGDTGGSETHTITAAESATLAYNSVVTDPGHSHKFNEAGTLLVRTTKAGGGEEYQTTGGSEEIAEAPSAVYPATTGITVATTSDASDDPHNNVQPTIILNKILVVE